MIRGTRVAIAASVGVLAIVALAACTSPSPRPTTDDPRLDAAVASVPHRTVAPLPATRLAKGLLPPTNRWFSGLVFGDAPQPVFPLPLSFGLTGSGFAFGVPTVTTGADTISGPFTPAVGVDAGAASSEVTAYDEATVTIQEKDAGGAAVGSIVIAEGSPVVTYTALRSGTLSLGAPFTGSGRVHTATIGGTGYGIVGDGTLSGGRLSLDKGQRVAFYAAPTGVDPVSFASHVSPITGSSLRSSVGSDTVTTTLSYRAAGPSAIAAMPHQVAGMASGACSLGSYPSVYGELAVCAGPTLSWTSPKVAPSGSLDLTRLSSGDKAELTTQLAQDLAATPAIPEDTYYGGKALSRLANILAVARQVGASSTADAARAKLDAELEKWADPKGCAARSTQCFVYDEDAKGVVGLTASFGSDQFNDHMFHYGYFLYAAGVAAKDDPSITARIRPVVDLLAADIATPGDSSRFPTRRVFDAYAGHSWASGTAPFADGNNLESSSEAVNAWNGLGVWAAATGDRPLQQEATWMLSAEAASATTYQTDFPADAPVYSGYRHGVVGIDWGAKRDYATWFSADANAKLGIQLIPMNPVSVYLGGDADRIARNISEAAPAGYDLQFGDYLLMYSALEGKAQAATALAAARTLPAQFIDDADSRSYLLAWIMART